MKGLGFGAGMGGAVGPAMSIYGAVESVMGIIGGLIGVLGRAAGAVAGFVGKFVGFFSQLPGRIGAIIGQVGTAIIGGLSRLMVLLWAWWECSFRWVLPLFLEWCLVLSVWWVVWLVLRSVLCKCLECCKNALDMNSPSRLFMPLGESIPEGMAYGVETNQGCC